MSYPTPPRHPGSAGGYGEPPGSYGQPPQPYGQPPQPQHQHQPGAWPQGQPQPYPGQGQYPSQAPHQAPHQAPAGYPAETPHPGQAPHPYPGQTPHPHPGAPGPQRPAPIQPPPKNGAVRGCLSAFLGVFGALGMLGGGFLINHAYSNASQDVSNRDEYGPAMWRNEPADKLFPEFLAPRLNATSSAEDPERATWHRVGISQDTDCADGLNNVTWAAVKKLGCKAVLRATYVDPTGNTVGTVALVVLPEGRSAKAEMTTFLEKDEDKLDPEVGAKALAVPDTIAAKWSDARSNGGAGVVASSWPYVLVASTGAVDGREAGRLPGEWGSHSSDTGDDRAPWRGAAKALCDDMEYHMGNLLLETS